MWGNGEKKLVCHNHFGSARHDGTGIIAGGVPDMGLRHRGGQIEEWDGTRVLCRVSILDGTPPISSLHPVPDYSQDGASPDTRWQDLPPGGTETPRRKDPQMLSTRDPQQK